MEKKTQTVMLSFSHAVEEEKESIVQWAKSVISDALERGYSFIFGGDIMTNGIFNHIADYLEDNQAYYKASVVIFAAKDIYDNLWKEEDKQRFKEAQVSRFPSRLYLEIIDGPDRASQLTAMRKKMAAIADHFCMAGGKTSNFLGSKPGLEEEFELAIEKVRAEGATIHLNRQFAGVIRDVIWDIYHDDLETIHIDFSDLVQIKPLAAGESA